jgi:hypothetical protein
MMLMLSAPTTCEGRVDASDSRPANRDSYDISRAVKTAVAATKEAELTSRTPEASGRARHVNRLEAIAGLDELG